MDVTCISKLNSDYIYLILVEQFQNIQTYSHLGILYRVYRQRSFSKVTLNELQNWQIQTTLYSSLKKK